jgi:hypothetical protein
MADLRISTYQAKFPFTRVYGQEVMTEGVYVWCDWKEVFQRIRQALEATKGFFCKRDYLIANGVIMKPTVGYAANGILHLMLKQGNVVVTKLFDGLTSSDPPEDFLGPDNCQYDYSFEPYVKELQQKEARMFIRVTKARAMTALYARNTSLDDSGQMSKLDGAYNITNKYNHQLLQKLGTQVVECLDSEQGKLSTKHLKWCVLRVDSFEASPPESNDNRKVTFLNEVHVWPFCWTLLDNPYEQRLHYKKLAECIVEYYIEHHGKWLP